MVQCGGAVWRSDVVQCGEVMWCSVEVQCDVKSRINRY